MEFLRYRLCRVGDRLETNLERPSDGTRIGSVCAQRPIGIGQRARGLYSQPQRHRNLRAEMESIGATLFRLLAGDPLLAEIYRRTLRDVRESRRLGRRTNCLAMELVLEDSESRRLPWELLFDPEEKLFLSTSSYISISRALMHRGMPPADWRPPLRALVIVATPQKAWLPDFRSPELRELPDFDTHDLHRFLTNLRRRCSPTLFTVSSLIGSRATRENLQRALQTRHDLLYFVGHSYEASGESFFLLEDGSRSRRGVELPAHELVEWLHGADIRWVVLSACETRVAAEALIRLTHLEAVVAMQAEVRLPTAASFDKAFFDALAAGQPIRRSVLAGRRGMIDVLAEELEHQAGKDFTGHIDWAVPVLYGGSLESARLAQIPKGSYPLGLARQTLDELAEAMGHREILGILAPWIGPRRNLDLGPVRIDRWPVTNHQYRCYLENAPADCRLPPGFIQHGAEIHLDLPASAPVVGLTWFEADAYCRYSGGRLPSSDEWEAAARGPEGRIFPWGDTFDPQCCSSVGNRHSGPQSVFLNPPGASPFGVEDLCGNVFEWTATALDDHRRIVVGGAFGTSPLHVLPSLRCPRAAGQAYSDVGFRCVWAL